MEWRLILASLLVCTALATASEEHETTTSRLHRSTFQEQLQWTTPEPTTESPATEDDAKSLRAESESEIGRAEIQKTPSTNQSRPESANEAAGETSKSPEGTSRANSDRLPASDGTQTEEIQLPRQKEEESGARPDSLASVDEQIDDKLPTRLPPTQTKHQETLTRTEFPPERRFPSDSALPSIEDEERKDPSLLPTTGPPLLETPAVDSKLTEAPAIAERRPTTSDENATLSSLESIPEDAATGSTTLITASEALSSPGTNFLRASTESPATPTTGIYQTPAAEPEFPSDVVQGLPVSADRGKQDANPAGGSSAQSSSENRTAAAEVGEAMGRRQPVELEPTSEATPLAEVTPKPNEGKLSSNASEDGSSSVEELPALSMMALKAAAPLVEFSYKEGTPKPPFQQNTAIQNEPAKPIGEITEDDHVVGNSRSPTDTEPPQPEGVLEVARMVTKMLEEKYTAEESRAHRRVGNVTRSNLPVVISQRVTSPRPHHRAEPSPRADYDYHSVELMRLRAKEHNNDKDLALEATGRTLEPHPRTSKIMNTAPSKDKMIFVKTVPKGSLITVEGSPLVSTTIPTTSSASPVTLGATPTVTSTAGSASSTPSTITTSRSTTTTFATAANSNPSAAASQTNAETTTTTTTTTMNPPPVTRKTVDDVYYDESTEIVDEEDVVNTPDKLLEVTVTRIADIEATMKVTEDRPVMALVVQNPPNENSLTRKQLTPLDTKDVQVSFILPAVSESSLVPHKPKPSTPPPKHVTEELSTESVNGFAGGSFEAKFGKPYPMQRATTRKPAVELPVDRIDSSATSNPMTTLAGGDSSSESGDYKLQCPSKEDIHPCTCVTHEDEFDAQVETVASCRGIKHSATLIEALRGFRGHHLTYLIIDNSDLPPFPNNILHRIQVDWMEVLNTPVQFKREYLQCSIKCTLS